MSCRSSYRVVGFVVALVVLSAPVPLSAASASADGWDPALGWLTVAKGRLAALWQAVSVSFFPGRAASTEVAAPASLVVRKREGSSGVSAAGSGAVGSQAGASAFDKAGCEADPSGVNCPKSMGIGEGGHEARQRERVRHRT
jgi:hypothetical protein